MPFTYITKQLSKVIPVEQAVNAGDLSALIKQDDTGTVAESQLFGIVPGWGPVAFNVDYRFIGSGIEPDQCE